MATKAAETEAACQYTVVLMIGNAARQMDKLEVQSHTPNSSPEFEKLSINRHAQLDDKNTARDELHKLQKYGSV